MMTYLQFHLLDQDMIKEFLVDKVNYYYKLTDVALQDITFNKGIIFAEGTIKI